MIKPVQVPQEKNGEQPSHGFEVLPLVLACAVLVAAAQTSSAQQGFTVNSSTYMHPNHKTSLMAQS
jgi:hypothetical protein